MGIASHSYNMAATPQVAQRLQGSGKQYWMTEASDNGPDVPGETLRGASLATRFLNDMNHGVNRWIHFVGFKTPDANDNATHIIAYTVAPFSTTLFKKYAYYAALSQAFDVGAAFRVSQSSLEGEMTYTYGKKPRIIAAAARNPDGTWAIAISNFTSPSFRDTGDEHDFAIHNSRYAAKTFTVTVRVPELAKAGDLLFKVRRVSRNFQHAESLTMRNGEVTGPDVGPLDLVTLRAAQ